MNQPAPNMPDGYAKSRRGEIVRQRDHAAKFRQWAAQCEADANVRGDDEEAAYARGRAAAYSHAADLIAQGVNAR